MIRRELPTRPLSWEEYRTTVHPRWALAWHAIDFFFKWLAWLLSRWAFLEVLEYLGALSVLVGVIFYFSESGDRQKQKHYQAWQVINTSQGKGGNGGRIDALEELNQDHVSLVGVDVSGAALQGIELPRANLRRASMQATDLRDCKLDSAVLADANLNSANFRGCTLKSANLTRADFEEADLVGASLENANLSGANFKNCDLRNTDLRGIHWQGIASVESANLYGAKNAPADFTAWAIQHGAISQPVDDN